jgi:predicted enzyme related to lactoylglutathione lyase
VQDAPTPNSFCWDTLLTDDAPAAAEFYARLFGYSIDAREVGPLGTYRMLVRDGRRAAGVMKHPADAHPHWTPYLAVPDVDGATRRAEELGGTTPLPPRDVLDFGRFSGVDDPTGAGLCLLLRP